MLPPHMFGHTSCGGMASCHYNPPTSRAVVIILILSPPLILSGIGPGGRCFLFNALRFADYDTDVWVASDDDDDDDGRP